MKPEQILYTTTMVSIGGRDGRSESVDMACSVQLSTVDKTGKRS
jgi:hypothetical protein